MERIASITRDTNETQISMSLNLDGSGRGNISTGIGFFDHMLNSFARHGFFDLDLTVKGDLEVDTHHTIEDTGIVLGQAIRKAVGDKKGIVRYGSQILPMDESLVLCALDLCGRPYLVWDLVLDREKVGDLETEMVREFFYAVSYGAEMNLHLKQLSGTNNHHIIEAAFKAFAKALDGAVAAEPRLSGVLSTKGSLYAGPVPEDDNAPLYGHTAVCHGPVPDSGTDCGIVRFFTGEGGCAKLRGGAGLPGSF